MDSPKFPTVRDLSWADPAASSSRPTGLYEELLQSRPEALYLDILDFPEKYENGVRELVQDLVAQRRDPTPAERDRLDRTILDFLAKPKPKAAPPAPKPAPVALPADHPPDDLGTDPLPAAGEEVRAFWWL